MNEKADIDATAAQKTQTNPKQQVLEIKRKQEFQILA